MRALSKISTLKGIIPPLITPLLNDDELDTEGLQSLLDHVIRGGVHGIFILGTTGELSRLSFPLREQMISYTCRIVNKRVPVLVGISDTSMHESLRLGALAYTFGADAAVLAPPYYYPVEQDELLDYFRAIAGKTDLPVFLYNNPARTQIVIEIETVVNASKIPGIVGIKDSSGDPEYIEKLISALRSLPGFPVFIGPEEFLAKSVLTGANGGVNAGANLFPELYVELYEAVKKEDLQRVEKLQAILDDIRYTLYQIGKGKPNLIKIIKEALFQKGISHPYMARPYIPFSEQEKQEIASCLQRLNIEEVMGKK
ncbi:MAG: dihydrodipicolinate synthase family protein [Bacteroidales bacterium]|nr:dihydrodipicolinate synthase family protein [Bacteroidales bacterium]